MPVSAKEFAIQVTRQLQEAGYTALFAGGCVRDALLGREPKDYDVATSALPEQVRDLFGYRKTLAIGAAFGVITVIGPKSAGHIEVATFRRDGDYSDGRHPDSVEFTDAREDAIRRDFTMNGMFFDPIDETVIDFVGGQEDLEAQIVRAIGDPHRRFDEDKLRMLRAVRFSTTFGFRLDPATLQAIQERASEIQVVSPERIGIELRKILTSRNRRQGAEILQTSRLINYIVRNHALTNQKTDRLSRVLKVADALGEAEFAEAVVALFGSQIEAIGIHVVNESWRLTNQEKKDITWLIQHRETLAQANHLPWSVVQPLLLQPQTQAMIRLLEAEAAVAREAGETEVADSLSDSIRFCRNKLALPQQELDPKPLLNGSDLQAAGLRPGVQFSTILKRVREQQLNRASMSKEDAIALAIEIAAAEQPRANNE